MRAGWFHCAPVSMVATVMPSPRSLYIDHPSGARMCWMFHSIAEVFASLTGASTLADQSGRTRDTSDRAATAWRVAAPDLIRMALMIQNGLNEAFLPLSRARSPLWLES